MLSAHTSIASVNLALNAAVDVLNTGFLDIYDSTGGTGQPATPDTAIGSQVKLAHLPLSATAFAAASAGSKTANAITSATALATGTATWFRIYKSDTTTAVLDGSVGVQPTVKNIASSTNAAPIVVTTSVAHGFSNGDTVVIASHSTNTAANGTWIISAASGSVFTLNGSTGNGVGGATGTATDSGFNLNINSAAIQSGATVSCSALTVTMAQ